MTKNVIIVKLKKSLKIKKMKGKLPKTGLLKLESTKEQWSLLRNGLIKELKITALIKRENLMTVRVKISITGIISPKDSKKNCFCEVKTNLGESISVGLARTKKFLIDYLDESEWILIGFINGDRNLPILIVYYEKIDIYIYSQKFKDEESKLFFQNLSMN
ncbi:MAG: hypothetical protein JJE53_01785 [Candidatus Pacebacteria bacterium]|nr:hypothetical protein [Candidatus Paceibacterota bacterium]